MGGNGNVIQKFVGNRNSNECREREWDGMGN